MGSHHEQPFPLPLYRRDERSVPSRAQKIALIEKRNPHWHDLVLPAAIIP